MTATNTGPYSDLLDAGQIVTVTPNQGSSVVVTLLMPDGSSTKSNVASATSFGPYLQQIKYVVEYAAGTGASVVESMASGVVSIIPAGSSPVSANVDPVTGMVIKTIWNGTQAQYDAIAVKDNNTMYIIVG